jgi:hypothetical protein
MKIGDTVTCCEDLTYLYKGVKKVVKKGFTFIIKGFIGNEVILDRFGKPFIVDKSKISEKK